MPYRDAAGNRLTKVEPSGNVTATYDLANQIATLNGASVSYDENGNLLNDGTTTYTYDDLDRLKSTDVGALFTRYGYTGDGDRLWQATGAVTTTFTLDLNTALTQVLGHSNGTTTTTLLPGVGQYQNSAWTYYHGDALGSVRHVTDESGDAIGNMRYSPFGERVESTGLLPFMGFTGEPQDPSSDLTYLRTRYYNPGLGRFITADSIIPDPTNGQAWNSYAYVYNDVTNWTDPSGHDPNWFDQLAGYTQQQYDGMIDWWNVGLEDCTCQDISPVNSFLSGAIQNAIGPFSLQGAWAVLTTPAQRVGTVSVEQWGKIGPNLNLPKFLPFIGGKSTPIPHITPGWHPVGGGVGPIDPYLKPWNWQSNGSHWTGLRTRVNVTGAYTKPIWGGLRGAVGTAGIAGLIDGGVQGISDWLNNPCLSNGQRVNRVLLSTGFGLISGLHPGNETES